MSGEDPLLDEEEEAVEEKSTGRNAFMAGLHKGQGDNFTGSFRGVPAPKRGGPQYVQPEDTLGDQEHCWCGAPYGHDWPGKEMRRPHPAVLPTAEEGNDMGAAAAATPTARLTKGSLRKFDDRVATMIMELVNTYGVRYRMQKDGQHVLLYPLNNAHQGRPHKVGAARHPEQTMSHLEQWVTEAVTPTMIREKAELLAAHFNDPSKVRRARKAVRAVEDEPKQAAEQAQEPAQEPASATVVPVPKRPDIVVLTDIPGYDVLPADVDPVPPEGFHRAVNNEGVPINWWTNGSRPGEGHYICMWRDYETDRFQSSAAHMRMHSTTAEQRAEVARAGNESRRQNIKAEKITKAVDLLLEATGIVLPQADTTALDAKVADQQAEINKLRERLAKAEGERDALKAKLDLIREGLSL